MRTRVGYAGGTMESPTYHSLGDHSETIQIDYDPNVISYEELLDLFWSGHSPTSASWSRQYMSIVFCHDENQERLATETRARQEALLGRIYTEIVPYSQFHLAEDYHQKYYLRADKDLLREYAAIYPTTQALIASTAVARANGYVGHHGNCAQLRGELPAMGLSPEAGERLERVLCDAKR